MAHYRRDLSSLPTLTREEEVELARRIQKGDQEALRKLVEGNLRFVVSVAAKYANSPIPLIDLINEGNIGLIKAAEKFDPDKGVKFVTYAVWWINATIKAALAKQAGVVGMPRKQRDMVFKIIRKEEELSKLLERDPAREEVAEALGLKPKDVAVTLGAAGTALSLDDTISDDLNLSYGGTLKADDEVDEALLAEEFQREIDSLVETLDKRERDIVTMRFGLDGHEPMTLRELGERMGLSKERIRQIEAGALKKLQEVAKERHLEYA